MPPEITDVPGHVTHSFVSGKHTQHHAIPEDDDFEGGHALDPRCACHPVKDEQGVWIHSRPDKPKGKKK